MTEVMKDLYVCGVSDLDVDNDYAVLCATKKYYKGDGRVLNIEGDNLYLNWVDANDEKYFNYNNNGVDIFNCVTDFIGNKIKQKSVVIYCDKGISRSPSIALVYMAKTGVLKNNNYYFAKDEFENIYSEYEPNKGIEDFIKNNWSKLM